MSLRPNSHNQLRHLKALETQRIRNRNFFQVKLFQSIIPPVQNYFRAFLHVFGLLRLCSNKSIKNSQQILIFESAVLIEITQKIFVNLWQQGELLISIVYLNLINASFLCAMSIRFTHLNTYNKFHHKNNHLLESLQILVVFLISRCSSTIFNGDLCQTNQ